MQGKSSLGLSRNYYRMLRAGTKGGEERRLGDLGGNNAGKQRGKQTGCMHVNRELVITLVWPCLLPDQHSLFCSPN